MVGYHSQVILDPPHVIQIFIRVEPPGRVAAPEWLEGGRLVAVGVVRVAAPGLGQTAADHVADGKDRCVQPHLRGPETAGVG